MSEQAAAKVTGAHLARTAYLYVRQSTLRQALTNTESAARQYALRQKAIALGWEAEAIVTIDSDQGRSGASAADREGFQRLVAEVGMGRAGIVLGLEVSRLARNNADWHRLLQICAMSGTLICDEDGLYDDVHAAEQHFCANWAGIPSRRLDRCPYLLFGRATQMAEALLERRDTYGLDRISLKEDGTDPVRFCREVLPLLSG